MNVLVIPEDFRKDQHILKPIFERMFREVGKPRARIRVCQDLLGGVRAEVQVKEECFEPIAAERELANRPGGGRKPLAEEAAGRFDAIRQKCREDFDVLVNRVQEAVAAVPD